MNDYVVGAITQTRFTVAKFGMGKFPETVYHIGFYGEYMTCTCPGGMHPNCKHRTMVSRYVVAGYPLLNCFWEEEGGIRDYFQSVTREWKRELEGAASDGRRTEKVGGRRVRSKRVAKAKRGR